MPVLRSIGQNPTEEEILNLVIEYDVNGDGTIDFEEFLEMMMKQSKGFCLISTDHIFFAEKIVKLFYCCWKNRQIIYFLLNNSSFFFPSFFPLFFFFARKIVNFLILDVDQTLEIKEAFKIFDRDGNGFIDAKELKQVVTRLGQVLTSDEADEFMLEADLDGDGKLDYNEFVRMMLQEAWSQVHFYYPQEKKAFELHVPRECPLHISLTIWLQVKVNEKK